MSALSISVQGLLAMSKSLDAVEHLRLGPPNRPRTIFNIFVYGIAEGYIAPVVVSYADIL
jgi:hypothetical protein